MNLATKHRPKLLKDIVGNSSAVASLRSLMEREDMPHAMLFTGPSGTGKTTLARIVASRLKVSDFDLVEMNAADFRGIDTVREIIRNMSLAPMNGSARAWLLDECHSLTKDAQHALLKALEDGPKHVWFLLATTEPEKLLPTIRTRCVTLELKPLSDGEIKGLLKSVATKEGMDLPGEVVEQIASDCQGSARMALTVLDKVIGMEPSAMLEAAKAQAAVQSEAINLCRALMSRRPWPEIAKILAGLDADPEQTRRAVLGYAQACLLKGGDNPRAYVVLESFLRPVYDSGKPGLTAAAYEASHG